MSSVSIFGTGGVAVVLLDVLASLDIKIERVFDDDSRISSFEGLPVTSGELARTMPHRNPLFVCIGDGTLRKQITSEINAPSEAAIHDSAIVSPSASVASGAMLFHAVVVQARATIGEHTIVNTGASVDHDCVVGPYVHLAPHSTLCGNVTVGERTEIGAGAVAIPGITIGEGCFVGAGSTVISDIPSGATAVGTPAKVIKIRE